MTAAMLGRICDGVPVPAQLITGVEKELLAEGSLGSAMSADLKHAELHEAVNVGSGFIESSEDALIQQNLGSAASVSEACKIAKGVLASQLAGGLNMATADMDLEKLMHAFGDNLADLWSHSMLTSISGLIDRRRGQEYDLSPLER